MLAINNCVAQSTQKTPYEIVFGQPARHDHDFWLELHKQSGNKSIVDEEDLPQGVLHDLNLMDDSVCTIQFFFFLKIFFILKCDSDTSINNDNQLPLPILSSNTYLNESQG
jgi:hypothetical protein